MRFLCRGAESTVLTNSNKAPLARLRERGGGEGGWRCFGVPQSPGMAMEVSKKWAMFSFDETTNRMGRQGGIVAIGYRARMTNRLV